jgi:hypothetical protein
MRKSVCFMSLENPFATDESAYFELASDGEEKLLLIDDATFVSAFAEAGQRRGKQLVCVRCFDPARALRAVVLLVEGHHAKDKTAGSVGFCRDCYRDLAELMFHGAILHESKSTQR